MTVGKLLDRPNRLRILNRLYRLDRSKILNKLNEANKFKRSSKENKLIGLDGLGRVDESSEVDRWNK